MWERAVHERRRGANPLRSRNKIERTRGPKVSAAEEPVGRSY